MSYRIYVGASTQVHNVGVDGFNEQGEMMPYADMVKYALDSQNGIFEVHRNKPGWTLEQTIDDCNKLKCDLFVDNHTNAGKIEDVAGDGGVEGTENFYHKDGNDGSKKFANILYNKIAPLSLGKDRGSKSDLELYSNGLYVLRNINCPASLIEHIFHTNKQEVKHYRENREQFAIAEAEAICEYFGLQFDMNAYLLKKMNDRDILNSPLYWVDVFNGETKCNPKYAKVLLENILEQLNINIIDLYLQEFYILKILNSPNYWLGVFNGETYADKNYSEKLLNSVVDRLE